MELDENQRGEKGLKKSGQTLLVHVQVRMRFMVEWDKIGYDVDLFDEAVRKIPFGEIRTREEEPSKDVNDQLAANERNLNDLSIHQSNQPNEAPASKPQPIQIKKEDIQFVSTQLEVGAKVAENALKRAEGSLEDALLFLIRETTTTSWHQRLRTYVLFDQVAYR